MKTKTIMLCTVALTLGACSGYSNSSGPRYTPRAEVAQKNYTQKNHVEDHMDKKSYKNYEERELCEHYRKPPRNYADGCVENKMVATITPSQPGKIISSYTILFDFDKSNIRANENTTLEQAMKEIDKYHPSQVTVTGYTDSSGDLAYNQALSHKREQAVSKALLERGIANYTLDRKARGEYEQAVKTADGVKNQQNRRVVIDFRR